MAKPLQVKQIKKKVRIGSLVRIRYILSNKSNFDQMNYLDNKLNGKIHYVKSYGGYNVVVNTCKLSLFVKCLSLNK